MRDSEEKWYSSPEEPGKQLVQLPEKEIEPKGGSKRAGKAKWE